MKKYKYKVQVTTELIYNIEVEAKDIYEAMKYAEKNIINYNYDDMHTEANSASLIIE